MKKKESDIYNPQKGIAHQISHLCHQLYLFLHESHGRMSVYSICHECILQYFQSHRDKILLSELSKELYYYTQVRTFYSPTAASQLLLAGLSVYHLDSRQNMFTRPMYARKTLRSWLLCWLSGCHDEYPPKVLRCHRSYVAVLHLYLSQIHESMGVTPPLYSTITLSNEVLMKILRVEYRHTLPYYLNDILSPSHFHTKYLYPLPDHLRYRIQGRGTLERRAVITTTVFYILRKSTYEYEEQGGLTIAKGKIQESRSLALQCTHTHKKNDLQRS